MKKMFYSMLGVMITVLLAVVSLWISGMIPMKIISASVFALLIGMVLNPLLSKFNVISKGIQFVSKKVLRLAIVLMGLTLSFSQVIYVGKYSFVVMTFTLLSAFGGGYLLGKVMKMNWKLSGLISAGTGICGGSAIAAIAPTIGAEDKDVAYAISATLLFDILMVVLFPIGGRYFSMSDMGFGLWAGTAVNDTSSVVAAAYSFSDAAGAYAVIVKLTRTLSIVPVVMMFSFINARVERKKNGFSCKKNSKLDMRKIFPYFILLFLIMVAVKSSGVVSDATSQNVSSLSKFLMVMALGAIGLKTNFKEVSRSGFLPMVHGFVISALVVIVSLGVQMVLGQF